MYKVILLPGAEKVYKKLLQTNRKIFSRIDHAISSLREDPSIGKALKNRLKGKYSLRVGSFRIIYSFTKKELIIYIFDIGHRRDIYR